jgi:hypothetical protein
MNLQDEALDEVTNLSSEKLPLIRLHLHVAEKERLL